MSDTSAPRGVRVQPARSVHSVLVLAPIGCWSASLVLDVASRFSADPALLVRVSAWLTGAGLIGAVIAGIAGMVAATPIPPGTAANRRVLVHMGLVMTLLVLYAFGLVLRAAVQVGQPAAPSTLVISAAGVLVLGVTGYTGRELRRSRRAGVSTGSQRADRNGRADSAR